MRNVSEKLVITSGKNTRISLAPGQDDALRFTQYTQRVWSKVAGRPISAEEAEQIIEDFGRFLRAVADGDGDQT